jgi:nucleotide-binding universal stress UspA family protein
LQGDPADALLTLCEDLDADLLVIGNRGMRGAKRFLLGSVSNRCAHHAPCSILIVHTS